MSNSFVHSVLLLILCISKVHTLECYECDSAENSECATRPGQQIEVEECKQTDDECVTVIVAGHTRRGCLSRLFPNKYCPEPCQHCKTNLCNRNVFPENRLRCYQCVGADCVNVSNKTQLNLPCPVYNENDRCYTNIIRETNVQRGCEYTNLPTTCPNICLKCNYNGCNNEPGVHEDTCFECSHTFAGPNPYCLRDIIPALPGRRCSISAFSGVQQTVKTCTNKLMLGHLGKCYTYINPQTGVAQRGCSTNKPFFPTGVLSECYGKNCNNECFSIACSSCNATTGTENVQCRSGLNLRAADCGNETYACFACETSKTLRRGCTNSSFVQAMDEVCYHCSDSDSCNSKTALRTCYHCSSRDDTSCASVDNSNRIEKRRCSSQTELCAITVVNKLNMVYVVRGCASTVPDCSEFDPYCVRCNGSLCNNVPIQWNSISTAIDFKLNPLEAKNGAEFKSLHFLVIYVIISFFIVEYVVQIYYQ